MRFLIFSWLLSLSPFSVADSQLPNCKGIYSLRKDTSYGNKNFWNACVGESTLELDPVRKKYFRYTGEFSNGDFNGYGVAKYQDGGEYRGFWKNNFPHGEGIFLFVNGEKQTGTFSRGRLVEPAGITNPDSKKETLKIVETNNIQQVSENDFIRQYEPLKRQGNYNETIKFLHNEIKKGELFVKVGSSRKITSLSIRHPADAKSFEKNQTWWYDEGNEFYIFLHNKVKQSIRGIVIDYSNSTCEKRITSEYYEVLVESRIANGEYSVVNFSMPVNTNAKGLKCLDIVDVIYNEDKSNQQKNNLAFDEERKKIEDESRQQQAQIDNDAPVNKPSVTKDTRRRVALVIGNASYKNAPLRNPTNDADLISKTLTASGFLVSRHDNLTYVKMREVVRTFGETLSKGDVGLFYYSGHAVQYRGKNYLLPINEDLKHSDEIPSSAMDIDFVLAKMESAKNDLNIVVLDACRNNPLGAEARNIDRGLTSVNAAKGTFIAFSTAPGNVALDGSGSNSPYTKNLAQAIRKGGMTLEQVFKEVRRNVISETNSQQVPWENSSILGDFYFK